MGDRRIQCLHLCIPTLPTNARSLIAKLIDMANQLRVSLPLLAVLLEVIGKFD
jgi:hypothetical protein